MNILISGGYGYVGNFIAQHLAEFDYHIIIGSRRERKSAFEFRPLTLDPEIDHSDVFSGVDVFIHASFDHIKGQYRGSEGEDPEGFLVKNFKGTNALFTQAKSSGVVHALFLSSRAVYGQQQPGQTLHEGMECNPDTLYGKVKLGSEKYLNALSDKQFCGTSLRVTGVFGIPYNRQNPLNNIRPDDPAFWTNHIQHMLNNPKQSHKWVELFTDYLTGQQIPPRAGTEIHGTELAKIIRYMLSINLSKLSGQSINISQAMLDHSDLIHALQSLTGAQFPLPERADISSFNQMSTDKLGQLFQP